MRVPAWVYHFTADRSYAGEETIEFHIPGNPLLARMLLHALIERGARHAEPGEFTARAYFSGRLDLAEAEGVAAIIAAHSEHEAAAARQLLGGELTRRVRPIMERLAESLALLEAGIDFSEEDVSFLSHDQLIARCRQIDRSLEELVASSARFERMTHEPSFVLIGRPNAGKSTLLNALAGFERAVVSPIAGTTRDALSAEVALPRGMVRLIDVAGVEAEASSIEEIDREMAERARHAAETADFIVLVRELGDERPAISLPRDPDLNVWTKLDLHAPQPSGINVSAMSREWMAALRHAMDRLAFGDAASGGAALALNARHLAAIAVARDALARVISVTSHPPAEVVALELREALDALGQIVGHVTPDDVLGRVFATFCIGK